MIIRKSASSIASKVSFSRLLSEAKSARFRKDDVHINDTVVDHKCLREHEQNHGGAVKSTIRCHELSFSVNIGRKHWRGL